MQAKVTHVLRIILLGFFIICWFCLSVIVDKSSMTMKLFYLFVVCLFVCFCGNKYRISFKSCVERQSEIGKTRVMQQ